ncbi:MAG: hypothetical protein KDK38_03000 [Leptospiraceae bacterium]|nr:hypothetical protein [Leptospiraceae bacterium]
MQFLRRLPGKLNRISLCKHLYYMDGHFFQKFGRTITEFPYLHIEGSPQPVFFNEVIHSMVSRSEIEVTPQIETEVHGDRPHMVLRGLIFRSLVGSEPVLHRDELKMIKSIAATLSGDMSLETRHFPNLYQLYAGTGLFEEISFMQFPDGRRPHLSWKSWGNRIFKLKWQ